MIRLALAFLLILSAGVMAEEKVVAGLSQSRVSITANFDGTGILVFGAVKRESPPPDAGPLQVIITVTGPSSPEIVRRKARKMGIWVNSEAVRIEAAPSFYAVASTGPLSEVLSEADDLRHQISVGYLIQSLGFLDRIPDPQNFSQALVRIRQSEGLYSQTDGIVELTEETLFRTQIALPSNLTEGDYRTRIFLTRDKKVVDAYDTTITVRKVGLERWIFNLAHTRPLAYGLLSLTIAVLAGWIASAVFRLLRLS